MDNRVNIFNEIVALQVYQNNKNYDQTYPDLSGNRLLYCSGLNPLHLNGLVMGSEKSKLEDRVELGYELKALSYELPTKNYELITPPPIKN